MSKKFAKPTGSAVARFSKTRYRRVARAVLYALVRNNANGWTDLVPVLLARLSEEETAGLAYSALRSLETEVANEVAYLAIGNGRQR